MENIEIKNIDEFKKMLEEFNDKAQREIMKKGYQEAAKPLIEQAKENAKGTRVVKSIGAVYNSADNSIDVGARAWGKFAGFRARWEEEGTKGRMTKNRIRRKGHSTGKITGDHFWSRAMESTEKQVFENICDAFCTGYEKIVAKYNRM